MAGRIAQSVSLRARQNVLGMPHERDGSRATLPKPFAGRETHNASTGRRKRIGCHLPNLIGSRKYSSLKKSNPSSLCFQAR